MIIDYLIRFVNIFYNIQLYRTVDSYLIRYSLYQTSDAIISDNEWNRFFNAFRLEMIQTFIQGQLNVIERRLHQLNVIERRRIVEHGVEINDYHNEIVSYESNHDMLQIIYYDELRLWNRYFDNLQQRITWRRRFRRWCGRWCGR